MTIIPNSGMVVTSDVGDAKHIHPADKPNVGKRLALWALAKTYNILAFLIVVPFINQLK